MEERAVRECCEARVSSTYQLRITYYCNQLHSISRINTHTHTHERTYAHPCLHCSRRNGVVPRQFSDDLGASLTAILYRQNSHWPRDNITVSTTMMRSLTLLISEQSPACHVPEQRRQCWPEVVVRKIAGHSSFYNVRWNNRACALDSG